jgi:hypothetical protein
MFALLKEVPEGIVQLSVGFGGVEVAFGDSIEKWEVGACVGFGGGLSVRCQLTCGLERIRGLRTIAPRGKAELRKMFEALHSLMEQHWHKPANWRAPLLYRQITEP